jgi:hypothetical protein
MTPHTQAADDTTHTQAAVRTTLGRIYGVKLPSGTRRHPPFLYADAIHFAAHSLLMRLLRPTHACSRATKLLLLFLQASCIAVHAHLGSQILH